MSDTHRLNRRPEWAGLEDHRAGPMLRPSLRELFAAGAPGPSTPALVAAYRTPRTAHDSPDAQEEVN